MSFTRIEQFVRVPTRTWVSSDDINNQAGLVGLALPTLYGREIAVVCLKFIDANGDAYALAADDEFELSIDSTRREVTDTSDLMAYGDNTQVDIAGDWADINRTNGKISIRVDCTRQLFDDRITEADGSQECWIQVTLTPNGESNHSTVLQDAVICNDNVINRYI